MESLTLSKEQSRLKSFISREYSDMVYNGLWFSAYHQDLLAYIESTQRFVSGTVRIKLYAGGFDIVGRKSDFSLFNPSLATYETGDQFDHSASVGFIKTCSSRSIIESFDGTSIHQGGLSCANYFNFGVGDNNNCRGTRTWSH
ncbi:argininosuccinate synthase domain-containing protein [Paenibacillus dakarensis]|uniref:argininosuccinate synthase domain-containing protein n=1 Tax=Paenibacillus dakarensis TaxID=1527293 RepID=UPI00147896BE